MYIYVYTSNSSQFKVISSPECNARLMSSVVFYLFFSFSSSKPQECTSCMKSLERVGGEWQ